MSSPSPARPSRRVLAGVLVMVPFAVVLLSGVLPQPERVPVHWVPGGVDGTASAAGSHGIALAVSGLSAVAAAVVAVLSVALPPGWSRWALTALAAMGGVAAAWAVLVPPATVAAGDPQQVSAAWVLLPLPLGAGWGWLTFRVHGRARPDLSAVLATVPERSRVWPPEPGQPPPDPGPWRAPSSSPAMLAAGAFGLAVLGGSAVLLAVSGDAAGAALVAVLAVVVGGFALAWARTELVVDARGLRVRSRLVPVTLLTVAPEEVLGVETRWLEPARWGGWGLRATPSRTAYIVRGGAGIVVHRDSGRLLGVEIVQGEAEAARAAAALRAAASAVR